MEIAEFLLARIAEDEAVLTRSEAYPHASHGDDAPGTYSATCPACRQMVWGTRERALAECEAKRRIVEYIHRVPLPYERYAMWRLLALPYADHPDYQQEWTPLASV